MKTTLYPIVLMAYAVATSQSGEFVNLTFDEPDLSHVVNPEGIAMAPVGEALRGWTIEWEKPGLAPLEWIGVKYGGAPLGLIEMGFGRWGGPTPLMSMPTGLRSKMIWDPYAPHCTFIKWAPFRRMHGNCGCTKVGSGLESSP